MGAGPSTKSILRGPAVNEDSLLTIAKLTAAETGANQGDSHLSADSGGFGPSVRRLLDVRARLAPTSLSAGRPSAERLSEAETDAVVLELAGVVNALATAQLDAQRRIGELEDVLAEMQAKLEREADRARIMEESHKAREALLQELREQLEIAETMDVMTRLWNKETFEKYAPKIFDHFQETLRKPLSYLFFDIDYFKPYNDLYGYEVGDFVIKEFSRILKEELRVSDLVFRSPDSFADGSPVAAREGGEEFSVLLPFTTLEQALLVAERIRKRVEESILQYRDPQAGEPLSLTLTVSAGVATAEPGDVSFSTMRTRVTDAIHEAKQSHGRNSVVKSWTGEDGESGFECVSPEDRQKPTPRERYEQ